MFQHPAVSFASSNRKTEKILTKWKRNLFYYEGLKTLTGQTPRAIKKKKGVRACALSPNSIVCVRSSVYAGRDVIFERWWWRCLLCWWTGFRCMGYLGKKSGLLFNENIALYIRGGSWTDILFVARVVKSVPMTHDELHSQLDSFDSFLGPVGCAMSARAWIIMSLETTYDTKTPFIDNERSFSLQFLPTNIWPDVRN